MYVLIFENDIDKPHCVQHTCTCIKFRGNKFRGFSRKHAAIFNTFEDFHYKVIIVCSDGHFTSLHNNCLRAGKTQHRVKRRGGKCLAGQTIITVRSACASVTV